MATEPRYIDEFYWLILTYMANKVNQLVIFNIFKK